MRETEHVKINIKHLFVHSFAHETLPLKLIHELIICTINLYNANITNLCVSSERGEVSIKVQEQATPYAKFF